MNTTALKILMVVTAAAAALLLGVYLGYELAERPCPAEQPGAAEPADTAPAASPPAVQKKAASGPVERQTKGSEPGELARLRKELERCEARLGFLQVLQKGYQHQLHGSPVPWDDSIPPQYRKEGFQAKLAQALDELEAPAELVGFDCREPPCVAVMRNLGHPGQKPELRRSKTWMESLRHRLQDPVDPGPGLRGRQAGGSHSAPARVGCREEAESAPQAAAGDERGGGESLQAPARALQEPLGELEMLAALTRLNAHQCFFSTSASCSCASLRSQSTGCRRITRRYADRARSRSPTRRASSPAR